MPRKASRLQKRRRFEAEDPVLNRIGDTPVISHPGAAGNRLQLKLETENPTRSMKDRTALGMVKLMEENGDLDGISTLVESSSGNTAGSVALVANRLGYDCVITTPKTTSPVKQGYVKALGAELVVCPDVDADDPKHYQQKARQIADRSDAAFLDQYHNELNPRTHELWTGTEIAAETPDITHLVGPMGTGGTLSGIAKHLKQELGSAAVKVIGVDAVKSNISNAFYGRPLVDYDTEIEGIGKGEELPTMWFEYIDEIRDVDDETAFTEMRQCAKDDGLLVGPSSAAAIHVAEQVTKENPKAEVLSVVCDGAEQYFELWEN